jgi:hypothetical protein
LAWKEDSSTGSIFRMRSPRRPRNCTGFPGEMICPVPYPVAGRAHPQDLREVALMRAVFLRKVILHQRRFVNREDAVIDQNLTDLAIKALADGARIPTR